ncbi:hypothetical protein KGD82_22700 [Nocardiopsis eucommiae]|uniref:Uncharacterized protein n=1 Tax=Nocardiopsis eucommiae TaxID=2831970 RepID=A0A975L8M7_9ACTN|nr:hypothetical protein KGD82_22700 [Nocardiopsis eucommiae]
MHPSGAVAPELLFTVARTLRAEAPGERAVLIEEVLRGDPRGRTVGRAPRSGRVLRDPGRRRAPVSEH